MIAFTHPAVTPPAEHPAGYEAVVDRDVDVALLGEGGRLVDELGRRLVEATEAAAVHPHDRGPAGVGVALRRVHVELQSVGVALLVDRGAVREVRRDIHGTEHGVAVTQRCRTRRAHGDRAAAGCRGERDRGDKREQRVAAKLRAEHGAIVARMPTQRRLCARYVQPETSVAVRGLKLAPISTWARSSSRDRCRSEGGPRSRTRVGHHDHRTHRQQHAGNADAGDPDRLQLGGVAQELRRRLRLDRIEAGHVDVGSHLGVAVGPDDEGPRGPEGCQQGRHHLPAASALQKDDPSLSAAAATKLRRRITTARSVTGITTPPVRLVRATRVRARPARPVRATRTPPVQRVRVTRCRRRRCRPAASTSSRSAGLQRGSTRTQQ